MKRTFKPFLSIAAALLLLFFAGCKEDTPDPSPTPTPTPTPTVNYKLEKVSGDNQNSFSGVQLAMPLKVKLLNQSGTAEANKFVEFKVTTGQGTLSGNKILTNQNGEAEITWTLSSGIATQHVKAYVADANNQPIPATEVEFTGSLKAITVAGGRVGGSPSYQLQNPLGLFVDADDYVYVADEWYDLVRRFAPGAPTAGVTVAGSVGQGPMADRLWDPAGVFVDAAGNVYVADSYNNRVQKWAPGATSGITVAGGNGFGNAPYQLGSPSGVWVDAAGNIFIADKSNDRVQKWARGATSGVTVASQLYWPTSVFVDAAGTLYVTDNGNNRVKKYAPGSTTGVVVAGGNGAGAAANQLFEPSSVYVDASGNVYVADKYNNRVQKWAPGASTGVTVAGKTQSQPGSGEDEIAYPTGVFVDSKGSIYVVDNGNARVQKWLQ